MTDPTPPDLQRLLAAELTRRRFLRGAGASALSLSALIAACGGGGLESGAPSTTAAEKASAIAKGEVARELSVSNWPLYIDVDENTKRRPTLDGFERKYGTTVTYTEEINDNTEFFGKVRQQLAQGSSGGRDIVVLTDWMAARMIALGYAQKLDRGELPNVEANLRDALSSPGFDPERQFTVPWQTGMTGLVYRRDLVKGDLTSVADLFDPRFKGKVTFLTEMRDSVGLVMLGEGADPAKDGTDPALAAIEKIDKASRDGQIRRFTGNDFSKDLLKGDAWVSVGWSGDAIQLQAENPDIRFVQPEEGFMLWSDNMLVPVGAPQAYTAQKFIDYVYDPKVQANIAAYVNYVTPVDGVKAVLAEQDPELAENPLIFPEDSDLERARIFRDLSPKEETALDEAFQRVVGA